MQMRTFLLFVALTSVVCVTQCAAQCAAQCAPQYAPSCQVDRDVLAKMAPKVTNQCISFSVGAGTGCAWMCAHCADALGPSYYFTDGVCKYQSGGCVGNPQTGVVYTCCSQ